MKVIHLKKIFLHILEHFLDVKFSSGILTLVLNYENSSLGVDYIFWNPFFYFLIFYKKKISFMKVILSLTFRNLSGICP